VFVGLLFENRARTESSRRSVTVSPSWKVSKLKWGSGVDERPPHLVLPAALLSGSTLSLRRLTLQEVEPESLSPLLSSATDLEELALTFRVPYLILPEASFIANLQRLSYLRRLELKVYYRSWDPRSAPNVSHNSEVLACAVHAVPLSSLTDFVFKGHGSYLQGLVISFTAPSLQRLDVEYYRETADFPLPQLCKFICDSECQFKVVRLCLLSLGIELIAETLSESDHAPPFKISIPWPSILPTIWEQLGQMLSWPLSTVEELSIEWELPFGSLTEANSVQWRGLFNHIPKVKTVQVYSQLALSVAHSFQLYGQPILDLLTHLEQVKVYFPPFVFGSMRTDQYASICDAFKPLMVARRQVGRPIKLSRI
jgi:hypothetical protein